MRNVLTMCGKRGEDTVPLVEDLSGDWDWEDLTVHRTRTSNGRPGGACFIGKNLRSWLWILTGVIIFWCGIYAIVQDHQDSGYDVKVADDKQPEKHFPGYPPKYTTADNTPQNSIEIIMLQDSTETNMPQESIQDHTTSQNPIEGHTTPQNSAEDQTTPQNPPEDQTTPLNSAEDQTTPQNSPEDQTTHQNSDEDQTTHQNYAEDRTMHENSFQDDTIPQNSIQGHTTPTSSIEDPTSPQNPVEAQTTPQNPIQDHTTPQILHKIRNSAAPELINSQNSTPPELYSNS